MESWLLVPFSAQLHVMNSFIQLIIYGVSAKCEIYSHSLQTHGAAVMFVSNHRIFVYMCGSKGFNLNDFRISWWWKFAPCRAIQFVNTISWVFVCVWEKAHTVRQPSFFASFITEQTIPQSQNSYNNHFLHVWFLNNLIFFALCLSLLRFYSFTIICNHFGCSADCSTHIWTARHRNSIIFQFLNLKNEEPNAYENALSRCDALSAQSRERIREKRQRCQHDVKKLRWRVNEIACASKTINSQRENCNWQTTYVHVSETNI